MVGNVQSVAMKARRAQMKEVNKLILVVMLLSVAYVSAQIFADITSIKIGILFGVSMDMGTLIYPLTFTIRDMVHKRLGKAVARILIVVAAAVNVIMALYFWIVSLVPYDTMAGPQPPFDDVLAPVWRIVVASIIAEVISEWIDGEVYEKWIAAIGNRWQWSRVLVSNAISIPIDSIAFCTLAFVGLMPVGVILSILLANVVVKSAMTLLTLPGIYAVSKR